VTGLREGEKLTEKIYGTEEVVQSTSDPDITFTNLNKQNNHKKLIKSIKKRKLSEIKRIFQENI
jgi:FlaA1/EpsC-like NDP-sugar epimerase